MAKLNTDKVIQISTEIRARKEQWRDAQRAKQLVRVDAMRPGTEGIDIDGRLCRLVRAHASPGAYVVVHVETGHETQYAGCAEWMVTKGRWSSSRRSYR